PLDTSQRARNPEIVILDEDEWPGSKRGQHYRRDDPVLHIELRRWADVLLIAPLDANTLAKLANGLADNCLTCVWRAWDLARPVLLAPAMNTLMWEHRLTTRHLRQLASDAGARVAPDNLDLDSLIAWMNRECLRLKIDEARLLAGEMRAGKVLLGGERNGIPVPGFDLGNSPGEYTAKVCRGTTLVLTTTNGTRALHRAAEAERVLIASFVNYS